MPLATLGTFILWLGWFGFNGGSQLKVASIEDANAVAQIFVNTNAAAAGGVIAALFAAMVIFKKADLTMVLNGALAGLVSITAEPLTPSPMMATMIGAVGGVLVVASIVFFDRVRVDDPVGAISVHGVCGVWGILACAIFDVTDSGFTIIGQLLGVVAVGAAAFIFSLVVFGILKAVMGVRVSADEEAEGLDIGEHGMEAYPDFQANAER